MKPTPAVIDRECPGADDTPGEGQRHAAEHQRRVLAEPNVIRSKAKIITRVTGTSGVRRSVADCSCSNVP